MYSSRHPACGVTNTFEPPCCTDHAPTDLAAEEGLACADDNSNGPASGLGLISSAATAASAIGCHCCRSPTAGINVQLCSPKASHEPHWLAFTLEDRGRATISKSLWVARITRF